MKALLSIKKYGDTFRVVLLKRADLSPPPRNKSGEFAPVPFDDIGVERVCNIAEIGGAMIRGASSLSRAKSAVVEKVLCNEFEYFVTLTIDKQKQDRFDLPLYKKQLAQFVRDERKRGGHIEYLFVPEFHKDGAVHMHGVVRGILEDDFSPFVRGVHPLDLCKPQYKRWIRYEKRFGFNSCELIRDKARCASYISKYITKTLGECVDIGENLYLCSRGLKTAERVALGVYEVERLPTGFENEYCVIENTDDISFVDLNTRNA